MNLRTSRSSMASFCFPYCRTSTAINHPQPSLSFPNCKTSRLISPAAVIRVSSIAGGSASRAELLAMENKKAKPPQQPWLIVGLGNPGKKYDGTRHNVGFEMVDAIAEAEGISTSNVSFKALFGKGLIGGVPLILAKPQTFMNSSDLPFGKLRLLPKGGHGGHNGMRSIIAHLKDSRDFPRMRIGIGRPPGKMDPVNFVLRPFNRQEREELDFTLQRGLEAVRILLVEGFDKSATFVNSAKALEQHERL